MAWLFIWSHILNSTEIIILSWFRKLSRWTLFLFPDECEYVKHTYKIIWTAGERLNRRKTLTVIYATKAVAKRKPEKNAGLNRIRAHDLCNAAASASNLSLLLSSDGLRMHSYMYDSIMRMMYYSVTQAYSEKENLSASIRSWTQDLPYILQ